MLLPHAPLEPTDRLTGQIGRYAIVRRLAVGGMAEVYLAQMRGPHGFARSVVLKRIRPALARDGQIRRMFADEARVAAHLSHLNIAQVIDVGEEGGEPFLVMEYVEGRDVHSLLADAGVHGLPIDIAVAIAIGVAAGLDHAHARRDADGRPLGIVHRDVSPSNVMVGFDGNVKLLDFGVAKAQGARDITRAGTVKGKLQYMSPEQALGLVVDRRSDLFSLGTVLYEMLVGARPPGEGASPARRRPAVPAALDALVARLLSGEPEGRPASAEEVSIALDGIAREERLSSSPVALRRYLVERFGEPEAVADAMPALFDEEPETASLSVSSAAVTAVTSVDQPADAVGFAETVAAPVSRKKRGALVFALAVAGALALIPVLAAGGDSAEPPEVEVSPAAPVAPAPERRIEVAATPLPAAPPEPVEQAPSPRPPAKRKRAPAARSGPAPEPEAAPEPAWDPDEPLLRSQKRRIRP